jgi:hypothetical protein
MKTQNVNPDRGGEQKMGPAGSVITARHAILAVSVITLLLTVAWGANNPTAAVLYTFTGGIDGGRPGAGLIADSHGNLYGTAASGGKTCGDFTCGVVFELSPTPIGWKETTLWQFTGGSDGWAPSSTLLRDSHGNLYGTTDAGGNSGCYLGNGCGAVFELSLVNGKWQETTLWEFTGGNDGGNPLAGLIFDSAGNLYGTASEGANPGCGADYGCGTVFELSPSEGGWAETTLYAFTGGSDGGEPEAEVIFDAAGNLYGTAVDGGYLSCYFDRGCGVAFELTPSGGTWNESVLYTFGDGSDGANPYGSLIFDKQGNLYGTAYTGALGTCNSGGGCGTAFELENTENGWQEQTLYSFTGGSDGGNPEAGFVFDESGNLFSTTGTGGNGYGSVFELKKSGSSYSEVTLHTFSGGADGGSPHCNLLLRGGYLYGTSNLGGKDKVGNVFAGVKP